MKTTLLAGAFAVTLGTQAGLAAAQQSYGDTAKVLSATPITERFKLDFSAEGFNVTNSTIFNGPASLDITNANFGRITSAAVDPRNIQFGLKYLF